MDVKLAGFQTAYGGFQATRNDFAKEPETRRLRVTKWLKKAFGWGNIILGSLPFSAKDAIEEIKGTIERGIDDGEDNEFSDGYMIFKAPVL